MRNNTLLTSSKRTGGDNTGQQLGADLCAIEARQQVRLAQPAVDIVRRVTVLHKQLGKEGRVLGTDCSVRLVNQHR